MTFLRAKKTGKSTSSWKAIRLMGGHQIQGMKYFSLLCLFVEALPYYTLSNWIAPFGYCSRLYLFVFVSRLRHRHAVGLFHCTRTVMLNLFPLQAWWLVPSPPAGQIWLMVPTWCPGQVWQGPASHAERGRGSLVPTQPYGGGERGLNPAPKGRRGARGCSPAPTDRAWGWAFGSVGSVAVLLVTASLLPNFYTYGEPCGPDVTFGLQTGQELETC